MNQLSLNRWSAKVATAVIFASSLSVMHPPAQAADPAVVRTAETSCVEQAQQKGFELKKVVYAGDSDKGGKDVKIVLNLLKDGGLFKLTCYYDQVSGASFGDEDAVSLTTKFPWWWLLLPILGLPALLAWAKGRDTDEVVHHHHRYYDAIVRGSEDPISVYAEPNLASKVIGYVHNGEAVKITDKDVYHAGVGDWVELATGGWIPKQYVGAPARV